MTSKPASKTGPDAEAGECQRIDKWLWYARVAKTRTLATKLIEGGKARVNRTRVSKPSRLIKPADVITLTIHDQVRVLQVIACGKRRGPAAEARELYVDLSPPPVRCISALQASPDAAREKGTGRPTKRDRRLIDAWRSNAADSGVETERKG